MTMFVRRLDANHDKTFGGGGLRDFATTAEATAQRLRCRLLVILGEWFMDTDDGVPWWQPDGSLVPPIMGGPRNLQYDEAVLKARMLATDGVQTIEHFSLAVDGRTRKLSIEAWGYTVDGDVWNIVEVFG